ncbi:MAG: adenylosuccinate synthase [Verrucomicrobiae bacterium]|nr:adenylosuccinate synthase [Verrucomicrobiae bacterium]MDW8343818.1 adenylosuccinate synthase [Verrucomicrobiae bacterium]
MATTILVGAQWGDEGKGKIIDVLSEQADIVVRYQGGNNAGHTVEVGAEKYVLHLIPSGILYPGKLNVIGNGVVVDPIALWDEIEGLRRRRVAVDNNLFVSETAHMVMPYHRLLDEIREEQKGHRKIGTTKRGIGPAYSDKVARTGLRIGDLLAPERFAERLRRKVRENNEIFKAFGHRPMRFQTIYDQYIAIGQKLKPFITDTVTLLNRAVRDNKNILFEGAQGTHLDIDFGTYPFVTSSNATAGGACTGSGIPPNRIDRVVGVMKAYTTRVGEGPFPTELHDEQGTALRETGREFGATTGRPRRCGWFDAVATRYAVMVNGINDLAVTKLDVLDNLPKIKVCVAYKCGRKLWETMPTDIDVLMRCQPVYQEFDGWRCSTRHVLEFDQLPKRARVYLQRIAQLSGARLSIVSVGARREETIFL